MGVDTKLRVDQDIMDIMKEAEDKMYLDKTINRKSINAGQIRKIMETLHRRSPAEEKHSTLSAIYVKRSVKPWGCTMKKSSG